MLALSSETFYGGNKVYDQNDLSFFLDQCHSWDKSVLVLIHQEKEKLTR